MNFRDRVGGDNLNKLRGAALHQELDDREFERRYYYKDKLRDALWSVNNPGLFDKIDNCGIRKSNYCGSNWCLRCRLTISKILGDRVNGYVDELDLTNDDMKMVTGVIGLTDVSVREVERNIKKDGLKWKRINRRLDKLNKGKFISVSYEFELVNGRYMFLGLGEDGYGLTDLNNKKENMFKREQLKEISKDSNYCDNVDLRRLFLFNHFHGMTNLDRDELKYVLGDEYFINGKKLTKNNDCGWYVKKFDKDKDIDLNVKKISEYGFKTVYRYKYNFIGNDFKNGEYFSNEELGRLIGLYDEVKGRGYRSLFRNIDNI